MLAVVSQWLAPFFDLHVTDGLDIIVVTAFVYTLMALLRQTRAAFVAIGILILSVVYIVARALGLQLTAWMLQGFFAIFVVIVVVIFQEELRQLFERVDACSWQSLGLHDSEGPHVSIEGIYQGHEVLLQVLAYAPDDEEPGVKVATD